MTRATSDSKLVSEKRDNELSNIEETAFETTVDCLDNAGLRCEAHGASVEERDLDYITYGHTVHERWLGLAEAIIPAVGDAGPADFAGTRNRRGDNPWPGLPATSAGHAFATAARRTWCAALAGSRADTVSCGCWWDRLYGRLAEDDGGGQCLRRVRVPRADRRLQRESALRAPIGCAPPPQTGAACSRVARR